MEATQVICVKGNTDFEAPFGEELLAVLTRKSYRRYNNHSLDILLADVIYDRDIETLSAVFKCQPHLVPKPLLDRLLKYACERFFDEGVHILLKNGADANAGVIDDAGYGVLANMIDHAGPERAFLMTDDELYWYLTPLASIIRALIASGANPVAKYKQLPSMWAQEQGITGKSITPINKLAFVALYGADAAVALVELTPARGLVGASDDLQCSPLSSALYDAMYLDTNFGPDRTKLLKIFAFAVIPLLRAGSTLVPDPLERDRVGRFLPYFCCNHKRSGWDNVNLLLWGRVQASIELVVAARGKASLNVAQFLRGTSAISEPAPLFAEDGDANELLEINQRFSKAVRAMFPLKLQSLCRMAITRNLPVGLKQRQVAIKSLNLPKCVANYLNFQEFEVPIHIIHENPAFG